MRIGASVIPGWCAVCARMPFLLAYPESESLCLYGQGTAGAIILPTRLALAIPVKELPSVCLSVTGKVNFVISSDRVGQVATSDCKWRPITTCYCLPSTYSCMVQIQLRPDQTNTVHFPIFLLI